MNSLRVIAIVGILGAASAAFPAHAAVTNGDAPAWDIAEQKKPKPTPTPETPPRPAPPVGPRDGGEDE